MPFRHIENANWQCPSVFHAWIENTRRSDHPKATWSCKSTGILFWTKPWHSWNWGSELTSLTSELVELFHCNTCTAKVLTHLSTVLTWARCGTCASVLLQIEKWVFACLLRINRYWVTVFFLPLLLPVIWPCMRCSGAMIFTQRLGLCNIGCLEVESQAQDGGGNLKQTRYEKGLTKEGSIFNDS